MAFPTEGLLTLKKREYITNSFELCYCLIKGKGLDIFTKYFAKILPTCGGLSH